MMKQDQQNIAEINAATTSFLEYGLGQVAYVHRVEGPDAVGFGIFAANGAQIALAQDSASAYGFLLQQELTPVSVH